MIQKVANQLRTYGPCGFLRAVVRRMRSTKLRSFDNHTHRFENKNGLEIGGASSFFKAKGLFPVYTLAAGIDTCNFSHETTWEGRIKEGKTFAFSSKKALGHQYIMEGCDLSRLESNHYDFLISSHVLEHIANPLLALSEWMRVIKPGGTMVLVLPHKDGTFDHRRPVTPLAHIIQDFEQKTGESDLTHLEEILALHDLRRDPDAGNQQDFADRSRQNAINRCLHHHVFVTRSALDMVLHAGLSIVSVEATRPYHIFILAEKPLHALRTDASTMPAAGVKWSSPFASDKSH